MVCLKNLIHGVNSKRCKSWSDDNQFKICEFYDKADNTATTRSNEAWPIPLQADSDSCWDIVGFILRPDWPTRSPRIAVQPRAEPLDSSYEYDQ